MNKTEILKQIAEILQNGTSEDHKYFSIKKLVNKRILIESYTDLDEISERVCNYFGITHELLNLRSKNPEFVLPRQFAHYLCLRETNKNDRQIAEYFGGLHRSTVFHSAKTIANYLTYNKKFRERHGDFLMLKSIYKNLY